jgi:hypothetical protein
MLFIIRIVVCNNDLKTQELVQGFDQETAAVVLARYISLKMEMEVLLQYFC